MFDSPVLSMVQMPCSALVIEEGYTDPEEIPAPLEAMRGMTRLFELKFNDRIRAGLANFRVTRIINEEEIAVGEAQNNPPSPAVATTQQGT